MEGKGWTKTEELESLKSGDWVLTSLVTEDWNVRVYGNAAVVMARNTTKAKYKGEDLSGQYRWTDTWIKRDGRWQCVAGHTSQVKQE